MKRYLIILMLGLAAVSCDENIPGADPIIPVSEIVLDHQTIEIDTGDSDVRLSAQVYPENATFKTVTWASSNPEIVEVDASGVLTGKSAGNAVVTATSEDGNASASCDVKVSIVNIPVTGVEVSPESVIIYLDDDALVSVSAEILPSNATNQAFVWSSTDESVVKVDGDGILEAVAEGTAGIVAVTEDGEFTDKCEVTVKAHKEENAENLLTNPGFENGLASWTKVPGDWFASYYKEGGQDFSKWNENTAGLSDDNLWKGNGADVKDIILTGSACGKLSAASLAGLYQIVEVQENQKYNFSVNVLWKKITAKQSIKDNETVKILSEDGLTLYGEAGIPAKDKELLVVEGQVEIPAGVSRVRIQIDQRDYVSSAPRAPLMLFDECRFYKAD